MWWFFAQVGLVQGLVSLRPRAGPSFGHARADSMMHLQGFQQQRGALILAGGILRSFEQQIDLWFLRMLQVQDVVLQALFQYIIEC